MAKILANGAEFYYELHGSGVPVVLIAGYGCDYIFWQPIVDELSHRYQVLIFDNRACGQTKDAGVELSANLMAADVAAICEQLDLKQPHIVGHSMGGIIAQTYAALFPDKLNKLIILNSTAKLRVPMLQAFDAAFKMREKKLDLNLILDVVMPWVYGSAFLQDKQKVKDYKEAVLNYPYLQTLQDQARQLKLLHSFDGREQLRLIQASTLIVYGHEDIVSLPDDSKYMAEHIANTTVIEVESAHGLVLEIPQKLIKILSQFMII